MKYAWIALTGLLVCWTANAETPVWMQTAINSIQKPEGLSGAEQEACAQSLIDELNHRMKTSLTLNEITPIQMPGWDKPEMGFMRGGGFNIRIVTSLTKAQTKHTRIKTGRFADFETWLKLGAQPSLHVPDKIDGQKLFLKTVSEDGERIDYDFVAHSDSAYAYLPIGVFMHLFRDVLDPEQRNPCPIEPHDRD